MYILFRQNITHHTYMIMHDNFVFYFAVQLKKIECKNFPPFDGSVRLYFFRTENINSRH
jgi:hypothetical protein